MLSSVEPEPVFSVEPEPRSGVEAEPLSLGGELGPQSEPQSEPLSLAGGLTVPDADRQRRRLRLLAELSRAKAVRAARLRDRRVAIRGLPEVHRSTQD
jgi:hypothetical protein